ncbi:MAG: DUF4302 domain-containing protein, partial [Draconibacterium sp.]
ELFSEPSAQRAEAAIEASMETLTSATNGWLMEYFPANAQEFGGYNVLLSFGADGTVTVASEITDPATTTNSLFSVNQSAGVVLSFDTYNYIFHAFSDPKAPLEGDTGYGMEGDYDFLMLEASPDKIVLKGKKSGGTAILTPAEADWGEYLQTIQEAEQEMTFLSYQLEMDGKEIPVSVSYRTLIFSDEGQDITASYIVTPTGYKFYQPVTVNGKKISGFTYDSANRRFTEVDNPDIILVEIVPPLNELFVGLDWYIAYSELGAFGQPYYDIVKQALDGLGEELQVAFIGSSYYGSFGFNFISSGYRGLLGLNYELIDEDKITLIFSFSGEGNGVWYHNNASFNYALVPFGYSSARTFTLTTDNVRSPSYITLTEDENPDNQITLSVAQITYPFNN